MSETFDPYHIWLGISPRDQPPNHYRLLGVDQFESDSNAISSAADMRMSHIRNFQSGKRSDHAKRLRNEIATARVCLLDPDKKSLYDEQLRQVSREKTIPPPLRNRTEAEPSPSDIIPSFSKKPKATIGERWVASERRKRSGKSQAKLALLPLRGLFFLLHMFLAVPLQIDKGLRVASGEDNDILHKFFRCVTVVLLVLLLGVVAWLLWPRG